MNILVVSDSGLYSDLTASFVHNQAKSYVSLGHRVRVVLPYPVGKTMNGSRVLPLVTWRYVDGVELCYYRFISLSNFGKKHFNTVSAQIAGKFILDKLLKGFEPDIIHAHTFGVASDVGILLKKKTKCPLVITTHGSDTNVALQNGKASTLCNTADQADAITAVSPILGERLRSCGTKTAIRPIINGFLPHNIPQEIEKKPYRIVQVGNLISSKRVDITIRAFAELKKKYPELSLYIVGEGIERKNLELLCQELSIEKEVHFLGWLPNQAVFQELCKSTFFVMASKPEGFGIVYLEAMAAGCVTIGTQGEGIDGFIQHCVNGFLVPADDVSAVVQIIDQCLRNQEKTMAIAQKGQQDAREQTWEKNVKCYIELFQSLQY